jgi:hypothetical protein
LSVAERAGRASPPKRVGKERAKIRVALREVFVNLAKYGRVRRLYGEDHQSARRFMELFGQGLLTQAEELGFMQLELSPNGMTLEGDEILNHGNFGVELAESLFAEGVRALVIERGVSREEAERFGLIACMDWTRRAALDDDLATMVWRAELEHIHLEVADRFSSVSDGDGEGLGGDGGRGGGGDGGGTGDSSALQALKALSEELAAGDDAAPKTDGLVRMRQEEANLLTRLRRELVEVADPGTEELVDDAEALPDDPRLLNELKAEVNRINLGQDLDAEELGNLCLELLWAERRAEQVEEIGRALATQAIGLLMAADPVGAAALVRRSLALLDGDVLPEFTAREALRRGLAELVQDKSRESFAYALNQLAEPGRAKGPLFTLLSPLEPQHRPQLEQLCAALDDAELAQVAADVNLGLMDYDEKAVLNAVEKAEGARAVGPLLALSRLKAPQAIGACMARVRDPEPRVREAALRALRPHQSPGIKQAVLDSLGDAAPRVRQEALRYLAIYRDPTQLNVMEAHLLSPELARVEEPELRGWLLAFAMVGRGQAVPLLRKLILKELSLAGDHPNLDGLLITALKRTQSDGGKRVLTEALRARPELEAVSQALGQQSKEG